MSTVKTCAVCGKSFTAKRADAKYCSNTCTQTANRILDRKAKAIKAVEDIGYTITTADNLAPTVFIPTGNPQFDEIIKGFPRKRVTELYGQPTVGKTTLMLQTIARMDPSVKVLYIDAENALSLEWVAQNGINPARLDVANPILLEEAITLTVDSLPFYDLIVFDSVASILFKTEANSEVGDHNIGVKAKLMTSFMRRLLGPLSRSDCAVVFINQMKPTIGDMYAPKWYTPGGKALEYASSLRLELVSNKADRITQGGEKVGKKVTAKITKSKVGTPDREATFEINYEGVHA